MHVPGTRSAARAALPWVSALGIPIESTALLSRWQHWPQGDRPMTLQDEAERLRAELEKLDLVRVRVALFGQPGAGKSS